jgi:hypothetical protein
MAKQQPISQQSHRIILAAVGTVRKTDPTIVRRAEFDAVRWRKAVRKHLDQYDPVVVKELEAGSSEAYIGSCVDEYIRNSRDPEIDNIRALDDVRKNVKRQRQIVRIHNSDGSYSTKEVRHCTPRDLDALKSQYEKSGRADLRRSKWFGDLAQQVRQLGLGETEQLKKLLA